MRKLLVLGSLVGVSLPLLAAAQPPPPPPPPPGGGGGGYTGDPTAVSEPKMRFDIGLIAGLPQDDIEEGTSTSPGVNLQFGYNFTPNVGLLVGARYFQVQVDDAEGVDVGYFDLDLGGRYTMPVSPTAKVFGEAMIQFASVKIEGDGGSIDGTGIGFGLRGGAMFRVSGNISIGAAVSYSTASVEFDEMGVSGEIDAGWIGLEGFASFGF